MFVALYLRTGQIHIVSYRQRDGNYRTICNKTIKPIDRLNTLAADNTFPGMCRTCKSDHDSMYQADLDDDPRMARNTSQNDYIFYSKWHHGDFMGPKREYEHLVERTWYKLVRYQRLITRSKKHV